MFDIESVCETVESGFEKAVFGLIGWEEAMSTFASALNSRTGQLIALGAAGPLAFNVMTNMADSAGAEFEAAGGADPWINSRVRVGINADELDLVDDALFTPEQDRARSPEFGEWIERHSIGYSCLSNLVKRENLVIGTAILRDIGQPSMTSEEKTIFRRMAATLRRAVRLQVELEGQQTKMVAGTFDILRGHAIVCGLGGRVIGMSQQAERLVAQSRWLTVVNGLLETRLGHETKKLRALLSKPVLNNADTATVVHDKLGQPLYLDICAFPVDRSLITGARTLVIARPPLKRNREIASLARSIYGLTAMEALVASYIAEGKSPAQIAATNGTSVGTVRTQLSCIFEKSGTRGQAELASILHSYF